MINFICSSCGKKLEIDDDYMENHDKYYQSWDAEQFHTFHVGDCGYGSSFDGCDGEFTLCDDCLYKLVNKFTVEGKEKVWNTGSNKYCDTETWIKYVNYSRFYKYRYSINNTIIQYCCYRPTNILSKIKPFNVNRKFSKFYV